MTETVRRAVALETRPTQQQEQAKRPLLPPTTTLTGGRASALSERGLTREDACDCGRTELREAKVKPSGDAVDCLLKEGDPWRERRRARSGMGAGLALGVEPSRNEPWRARAHPLESIDLVSDGGAGEPWAGEPRAGERAGSTVPGSTSVGSGRVSSSMAARSGSGRRAELARSTYGLPMLEPSWEANESWRCMVGSACDAGLLLPLDRLRLMLDSCRTGLGSVTASGASTDVPDVPEAPKLSPTARTRWRYTLMGSVHTCVGSVVRRVTVPSRRGVRLLPTPSSRPPREGLSCSAGVFIRPPPLERERMGRCWNNGARVARGGGNGTHAPTAVCPRTGQ